MDIDVLSSADDSTDVTDLHPELPSSIPFELNDMVATRSAPSEATRPSKRR